MYIELDFLPGLKQVVTAELQKELPPTAVLLPTSESDTLRLQYGRSPLPFHQLRTITNCYLLLHFDIPRPKALLGHEHFSRLTGQIDRIRGINPSGSFKSFRFGAAGKNSSVFNRLKEMLIDYTHMENNPEDADLLVRVRPSLITNSGWDILIRTTPRPLTTRSWRSCDMLGALNGTIAAAMVQLTNPQAQDIVFNPMCGSATLMIERAIHGPFQSISGCDLNWEAIQCAETNIATANLTDRLNPFLMDGSQTELPDHSQDLLLCDLPWGHRTGSHEENEQLYPAALKEFSRITAPNGRLAIVTHEITLMEETINLASHDWSLISTTRILQGGLNPRIYLLHRK